MISVIVCSADSRKRAEIAAEIAGTIGLPYELVVIENDLEKLSICAAYNKGASIAKYDVLCFIHEDLSFHSENWGTILLQRLENQETGFLGLAGSVLKTRNPSPWWIANDSPLARKFQRTNFIQSGNIQETSPEGTGMSEVLCLDGFFLACRREVWNATRFDQQTLRGFHFYDMDICLEAHRKGWKNYVFTGAKIEHHSTGSINEQWLLGAEKFQQKWQAGLPQFLQPVDAKEMKQLEQLALVDYIHALIAFGYQAKAGGWLVRLLINYKKTPAAIQVAKLYCRRLLRL